MRRRRSCRRCQCKRRNGIFSMKQQAQPFRLCKNALLNEDAEDGGEELVLTVLISKRAMRYCS